MTQGASKMSLTRKTKIAVASVLGAATLGGGAIAATVSASNPASDLATAINKQAGTNLSADQVSAAFLDLMTTRLATDVAAGRITQAEADAMLARAKANPGFAGFGRAGFGRGGPGGFGGGPRADLIAPISALLKLTATELRTKLDAGTSLAAIAKAQGVGRDDLLAAIKKAFPSPPAGATAPTAAQLDELATHIADETGGPRGQRGDDGGFRGVPRVGGQSRGQYKP